MDWILIDPQHWDRLWSQFYANEAAKMVKPQKQRGGYYQGLGQEKQRAADHQV